MHEVGNKIGVAKLQIGFKFLNKILTQRSIEEDSLHPSQFIEIEKIDDVNNDEGIVVLDCSIFQHHFN